jgi:hypothetical protein
LPTADAVDPAVAASPHEEPVMGSFWDPLDDAVELFELDKESPPSVLRERAIRERCRAQRNREIAREHRRLADEEDGPLQPIRRHAAVVHDWTAELHERVAALHEELAEKSQ